MAVLRVRPAAGLGFRGNPQKWSRPPGISGLAVSSGHLEGMCCRRFKIDAVYSHSVTHPDILEGLVPRRLVNHHGGSIKSRHLGQKHVDINTLHQ
jgi:hypothetical protein